MENNVVVSKNHFIVNPVHRNVGLICVEKASDEDVLISWSFIKMTLDVEALTINRFVEGLVDKRHPWTPSVPLIRLSCFVFVYI